MQYSRSGTGSFQVKVEVAVVGFCTVFSHHKQVTARQSAGKLRPLAGPKVLASSDGKKVLNIDVTDVLVHRRKQKTK